MKIIDFRTRKRYCARRSSVLSDQIQKVTDNMANNNISNSLHGSTGSNENRHQSKIDSLSHHTIVDDETTTDWIPEIPFWNVRSKQIIIYSKLEESSI